MRYSVPSDTLNVIRELRIKQHQNARAIGEAVIEYRLTLNKIMGEPPGAIDYTLRIGVLQVEYENSMKFFFEAVAKTQAEQSTTGETALAELGLSSQEQFRIDEDTGVVSKFETIPAPAWIEDF